MSQSDTNLLSFPKTPRERRPRDPRIDAFRGLALAMIFIDHMPGNPYEHITLRNWGFSDAAEAFFVMSGIAAGLAYSGRFLPEARAEKGIWPAIAPVWSRAWTLYLVHIFLTLAAITLFAAGAEYFGMQSLLQKHNLGAVWDDPQEVLFGLTLLGHQIGYVNILPVYTVLLLGAPAAILLALKRPWLLFFLSAGLWFAAGLWRLNMPNFPRSGGWFLSPASWQFIFVTGLLIGIYMRRGERFVARSKWLFGIATAVLVLTLVWKYVPGVGPYMNNQMWQLSQHGLPFHITSHNKTYLGAPRLLHALALVYFVSCLPWVTRMCAHRLAAPLRLMGRQGLLVFGAGTVLALGFQVLLFGTDKAPLLAWGLPPIGLALLMWIAWIADWRRRRESVRLPDQPSRREDLRVRGAVT
ncbi:OpgC family protein [Psychromarinibacter halotolerans]|uniref:OpgC family protein n=1 Tax=Psychromarinibacter halotolerans TaxID=1775175 RepID=A0ABV7GQ97_9RHOB|nr:OpgC domain-containing protein [Psychromarinibacter halotolerans]MDF0597719.1 OpgC domain-containing protein [Psychromarinibacter halotolerans]